MAVTKTKRRAPGEVRDAILKALASRPKGATVGEIHAKVEKALGGNVARSSVRSYLNLGTDAKPAQFKRIGRGSYRLAKPQK